MFCIMLARIIIFTRNMNDSVDRSLIYRNDEDGQLMKEIQGPLKIKIALKKKIVIAIAVVTTILLVGTCYFAFSPASPKEVLDQNKTLRQLNSQLKAKSAKLAQRLRQSKDLNIKLVDQNISLFSQLQQNNDLINYLQKDIELNCNPLKQRLRFNMTNMDAFTLSATNTNTGSFGGIPEITFLNMSGDSLRLFKDNSLPSLEYLDLTDNPITIISNNKLGKIVDLVGANSNRLLNEFTSNYMLMIRTLNLSHNNISVFKDNTISVVQNLDISDNKLRSFSSFNLGALQRLNISANPIIEFSMNNFTNLVEFSCLFLVGPADSTILFNDSYFGKVKSMQLRSTSNSYPPASLSFKNNYFPSLTNLTLNYFTIYFQSLKTNRMAELIDLKILYCNFYDNIQQWSSLLSLQYVRSSFKAFSGHSYPKMVRLHINQSNVQQFNNNSLPLLEELILNDRYGSTVLSISNNTFNNLKTLVFSVPTNSDLSWIRPLRKLQYLEMTNTKIGSFEVYDMPLLRTLRLEDDSIITFKNNILPSLKNLAIRSLLLSFDLSILQGQLESLEVSAHIKTLENYSFLNLKYLQLYSYNSCTFNNNSLPVLQDLKISDVDLTESNQLPVLKYLLIYSSSINFLLPHKFEATIETLVYVDTYATSFDSYNMPNLKRMRIFRSRLASFTRNKLPNATVIYLSGNHLSNFQCGGLPAVQELDLSYNQLTDKIADTLINCKFSQLISLNLDNNQIKDINEARKKLNSAYPRAAIKY